jgi:hypothetical protein
LERPPTLPIATGIPVTPQVKPTRPGKKATPTATVEAQPTPANVAAMFGEAGSRMRTYQPPDTDSKPLFDALARGMMLFLQATANGDVSLEGQPALAQLEGALKQLPNLPPDAKPRVVAIHLGDDQGGSRDLVFAGLEGVMGLPIVGVTRLGSTYEVLPPVSFQPLDASSQRDFYIAQLDVREMTGAEPKELVYIVEYPGGIGTTNELTVARWNADTKELHTIFHAALINWAGESDYQIDSAADASTIKLTFPWFGAFDHKMVAHPNATQTWEYDDKQDQFVRVSQTVEASKTPRQQLNVGEYALRNGDLSGAVEQYQKAYDDPSLQAEDFGDSKADPAAFAKFRQAMVLGLLGRDADARKLLTDLGKSGQALKQLVEVYVKNATGSDAALHGWIAMVNAGDLYTLIYESKAGNLDFPFEASQVYMQGGIVATYLNTHPGADKDPEGVWSALAAMGFKPTAHLAADLNGDGVNEFLLVTQEGGKSDNKTQELWFVYQHDNNWRVRSLYVADSLQFNGQAVPLPPGKGQAIQLKLPDTVTPNKVALTWTGKTLIWLDAATLKPRSPAELWPAVGGGVLEDDF